MKDAFFTGWSVRSARPLTAFLAGLVITLVLGSALLALAIGRATDDPGQSTEVGARTVSGIVVDGPFPYLVMAPSDRYPRGHTILLTAQGKTGFGDTFSVLNGQHVILSGLYMQRSGIDMLEVTEPARKTPPATPFTIPPTEDLGTWRITGELCDGKCYIGWMRPGAGPVHKACANICLVGGVPPVLVSTGAIEGSFTLLPLGPDGGVLPDRFRDLVGIRAAYEGAVLRVGDLLIFKTDLNKARSP